MMELKGIAWEIVPASPLPPTLPAAISYPYSMGKDRYASSAWSTCRRTGILVQDDPVAVVWLQYSYKRQLFRVEEFICRPVFQNNCPPRSLFLWLLSDNHQSVFLGILFFTGLVPGCAALGVRHHKFITLTRETSAQKLKQRVVTHSEPKTGGHSACHSEQSGDLTMKNLGDRLGNAVCVCVCTAVETTGGTYYFQIN